VGGKEAKPLTTKDLGFDPCSITFYPKGDYMVMAGSDKKITLWNRDAVNLGKVGEMKDWIWSTALNPVNRSIFSGANNG
jgi:intraflagellar transport protein 122